MTAALLLLGIVMEAIATGGTAWSLALEQPPPFWIVMIHLFGLVPLAMAFFRLISDEHGDAIDQMSETIDSLDN